MKIILGDFITETFLSKNPQFSEQDLIARIEDSIAQEIDTGGQACKIKTGYREGVILVEIEPRGFKRRFRTLVEGDYLFGKFTSRVKGETPRKKVGVLTVGELPNAEYVDAVLYHIDVIKEGMTEEELEIRGDNLDFDYEVVAFLTKDTPEEQPMETEVLLHNKFKSDGGTDVKMTDEEFVKTLKKSFNYWKNRSLIQ